MFSVSSNLYILFLSIFLICIFREKLAQFLRKVRLPSGSFVMNVDGEEDIRGAFCALIVARLINLSLSSDIFCNTAHWVSQ